MLASDPALTGSEMKIGLIVAYHFNREKGFSWPSVAYLAALAGLHRITVITALKGLERRGYMVVERGGGRGRTNRYIPNFARAKEIVGSIWEATRTEKQSSPDNSNGEMAPENHVKQLSTDTETVASRHGNSCPQATRFSSKDSKNIPTSNFEKSAYAGGSNENAYIGPPAGHAPTDGLAAMVIGDIIRKLAFGAFTADEAFGAFCALWPKKDRDPEKLKAAWFVNVVQSRAPLGQVVFAALAWFVCARLNPEAYFMPAGFWLKQHGWVAHLPYPLRRLELDAHQEALAAIDTPEGGTNYVLTDLYGRLGISDPWGALVEAASWPDEKPINARGVFFKKLIDGNSVYDIIAGAKRIEEANGGKRMPFLGQFLAAEKWKNIACDRGGRRSAHFNALDRGKTR